MEMSYLIPIQERVSAQLQRCHQQTASSYHPFWVVLQLQRVASPEGMLFVG